MDKQFFYKYITNPIAKFIDFWNIPKSMKIRKKRKKIADMNKNEYIQIVSNILLETELQEKYNQGLIPNPAFIPYMLEKHILRATEMFYEKKLRGDFDDLNILIN